MLPLTSADDRKRAWIGMFAAFMFFALLIQLDPFIDPMTNEVLKASQFQILFMYMAALLISTDAVKTFDLSDSSLGVGLCLVNFIVVAMVFTNAGRRLRSHLQMVPLAPRMLWHFFISHAQVRTLFLCIRHLFSSDFGCILTGAFLLRALRAGNQWRPGHVNIFSLSDLERLGLVRNRIPLL